MAEKHEDAAMRMVRDWWEAQKAKGLSLHDLGLQMGYAPEIARQSAFQFLKTGDPRISMLRRFAKASGLPLEDLVAERKKR